MGKTSAPPLDGEAIRQARVRRCLTQAEVQEKCAVLGVKFERSGLSYIENGRVTRPSLKVVCALAEVLGLEVDEMFKADAARPPAARRHSPRPQPARPPGTRLAVVCVQCTGLWEPDHACPDDQGAAGFHPEVSGAVA